MNMPRDFIGLTFLPPNIVNILKVTELLLGQSRLFSHANCLSPQNLQQLERRLLRSQVPVVVGEES